MISQLILTNANELLWLLHMTLPCASKAYQAIFLEWLNLKQNREMRSEIG